MAIHVMNDTEPTPEKARALLDRIQADLRLLTFYRIENNGTAITCLICYKTSWSLGDVEHHYCARCCLFLDTILPLFTISFNTTDYPGCYTVRRFLISEGRVVPDIVLGAPHSLAAARALLPATLSRLNREPDDDPVIVESWI